MVYLILIHAVGLTGSLIAKRLRIPAGALLGSMVFVSALNILSGNVSDYPIDLRVIVQVVAGAAIGMSFTRADLTMLRRLLRPAVILMVMMISFNVLGALVISRFTALDPITALFAAAPGGVSDMALIAADFGANTQQVAFLQMFRFVFIVSLFPFIVRRILNGENRNLQTTDQSKKNGAEKPRERRWVKCIVTLLAAGAGAALARGLGLPAGAVIGSLVVTVIMSIVFQAAYLPKWTRTLVQAFAGCFIGSRITLATLAYFQLLLLPMAIALAQLMVMTFSTAWMLRRCCGMDRAESLFSCIPGGLAEMSVIAQEMGLRVPEIVMMSTCRLVSVICMMPILLLLFTQLV